VWPFRRRAALKRRICTIDAVRSSRHTAYPQTGITRSGDAFLVSDPSAAQSVSCLVADDHPAVLEAVSDFLEQAGIRVAGRARDGEEALAKIDSLRPQVALVDLRMPKVGGIELARQATRTHPETAVILYTGYGDRAQLTEALDAGARGFVLKEAPLDDLVRAVETVGRGDTYVDPVLAGVIASAGVGDKMPTLTQRERDVLRLLADGLSNEEIGKRLYISAETVRTHIRKAMDKLDADTRTQAVAKAIRQSLIA
jgi:DNA-binding NarL/FixJ family response regulator